MFSSNNRRRSLPFGLTALAFCVSSTLLHASTRDVSLTPHPSDITPQTVPVAPATDTPSPTSQPSPATSVVMPPTSTRPTEPLPMAPAKAPAYKPHPILLAPPPDDTPAPGSYPNAKSAAKPAPAAKPNATAKKSSSSNTAPSGSAAPVPMTREVQPVPSAVQAVSAPVQEQAPQAATPMPTADSAASTQGANTFGFFAGETREQIIAAVGQTNILKQSGDILEVAASPKPDPNFETFLLIVGKNQGLVKLIATGKDIDGDPAGHEMKAQFTSLKATLGQGYGDPSDNFDFLDVKATHRGANQFMLSLTNSERTLAVYWTKKDFGNQITSVSLEGNGLGSEKGYLSLEYEFAGYHAYLLAKK